MALTYKQSKLVRDTIPALQEHGERIASTFYSTMLRDHPELRNYFNASNQENGRQPRALTSIILAFAKNISHTSELIPKLERICNKHCSLSIEPKHYSIVGEYLIRSFKEVLGPAMTTEVQSAWTEAYYVLARMMMGREAQLYHSFGDWQTWRPFKIDRKVAESEDVFSFYLVPVPGEPTGRLSIGSSTSNSFNAHNRSSISVRSNHTTSTTTASSYHRSAMGSKTKTTPEGLPYYSPGQYISVRLLMPDDVSTSAGAPGGEREAAAASSNRSQRPPSTYHYQARQYSMSDCWRPDYYRISVKRDVGIRYANTVATSYFHPGIVSNALIDYLQVGDTLDVSHPAGEFYLPIDQSFSTSSSNGNRNDISSRNSNGNSAVGVPLVLISAGIGASPMMAMLKSVAEAQPTRPVTYIHGSHYNPPVFSDQIEQLHKRCPRLRTVYFVSSHSHSTGEDTAYSSASSAASSPRQLTLPRVQGGSGGGSSSNSCSSTAYEMTGRVDLSRLVPSSTPASDGTRTPPSPTTPVLDEFHLATTDIRQQDLLFLKISSAEYYVCGPEPFMLDMALYLIHEMGISRQRIKFELFSTGDIETDKQDKRLNMLKE